MNAWVKFLLGHGAHIFSFTWHIHFCELKSPTIYKHKVYCGSCLFGCLTEAEGEMKGTEEL